MHRFSTRNICCHHLSEDRMLIYVNSSQNLHHLLYEYILHALLIVRCSIEVGLDISQLEWPTSCLPPPPPLPTAGESLWWVQLAAHCWPSHLPTYLPSWTHSMFPVLWYTPEKSPINVLINKTSLQKFLFENFLQVRVRVPGWIKSFNWWPPSLRTGHDHSTSSCVCICICVSQPGHLIGVQPHHQWGAGPSSEYV